MNLLDRAVAKALALEEAQSIVDSMLEADKEYLDIIATVDLAITDKLNGMDKISVLDETARYYRKKVG